MKPIGGSFGLEYDFGSNAGQFDMHLQHFGEHSLAVTGAAGVNGYAGALPRGPTALEVTGAFAAGGGSPVAATAGNFSIFDSTSGTAGVGVYGGDAVKLP